MEHNDIVKEIVINEFFFLSFHLRNRQFPQSMRSEGKRPGCGSRQARRPRRRFRAFLFRKETLTGHYFILKFDSSLGTRTNYG